MGTSKYSPEFRADAVALYHSSPGGTYASVAKDLGVNHETFRTWVRDAEQAARPGAVEASMMEKENRQLRAIARRGRHECGQRRRGEPDALEHRTGRTLWEAALEGDGTVREKAFVVEVTGLLGDLSTWPTGHRVFVRREPLDPRYARDASAYEREHGVRLTAFATNTPGRQPAWLDLRHRGHSWVEPKIRDSKAESLARFPSRFMKINQAWLTATALACDLLNWLQLLGCHGDMARATPKALRYRFLHVPAVLVRGQRRRRLKIPASWPWAERITQAFRRLQVLPAPT